MMASVEYFSVNLKELFSCNVSLERLKKKIHLQQSAIIAEFKSLKSINYNKRWQKCLNSFHFKNRRKRNDSISLNSCLMHDW